eukprot:g14591.t1
MDDNMHSTGEKLVMQMEKGNVVKMEERKPTNQSRNVQDLNAMVNPMHDMHSTGEQGAEKRGVKVRATEYFKAFKAKHPVLVKCLIAAFGLFTSFLFYYDIYTDIMVNLALRKKKANKVWINMTTIFLVLPYVVMWFSLMSAGYVRYFSLTFGTFMDFVEKVKGIMYWFWFCIISILLGDGDGDVSQEEIMESRVLKVFAEFTFLALGILYVPIACATLIIVLLMAPLLLDLLMPFNALFLDDRTKSFMLSYELLRTLVECAFESFPQSVVQLWLLSEGVLTDSNIYISFGVSLVSLIYHIALTLLASRSMSLSIGKYLSVMIHVAGGFPSLVENIESNTMMHLKISYELTLENWDTLRKVCKRNTSLKRLTVAANVMTRQKMEIIDILCSKVSDVTMKYNSFIDDSIEILCTRLASQQCHIKRLALYSNKVTDGDIDKLSKALESNTSLREVNFGRLIKWKKNDRGWNFSKLRLKAHDIVVIAPLLKKITFSDINQEYGACCGTSRTLLDWAVENGQCSLVKYLLVHEEINLNEHTCYLALEKGYANVVKLFLARDEIDVNIALHLASENGHTDVVKLLLARDEIDVNITWHLASENGHTDVVKLARDEIDVNNYALKDYPLKKYHRTGEMTPLHRASEKGYANVVKLLLARDEIDVNAKDGVSMMPLHYASKKGYANVVKLLLARDEIDVNAKDKRSMMPLHYASKKDVREILLAYDGIVPVGYNW